MSPTKLLIELVAVVLFATPVALAETAQSAETAAQTSLGAKSEEATVLAGTEGVDAPEVLAESATPMQPPADADTAAEPQQAPGERESAVAAEPSRAADDPSSAHSELADAGPAAPSGDDSVADPQLDAAISEPEPELEIEGLAAEPEADSVPAAWDSATTPPIAVEDAEAQPEVADSQPPLGSIGYDSEGRRGRVHIVVTRDTLWDISNAYLGTPWVWPSIWKDNGKIENPHLIHPGDHIWITPSEMRRVTPEEAALLLANRPTTEGPPAASEDAGPDPSELVPVPAPLAEAADLGTYRVSSRESAGLVTQQQLEASASIVEAVPERVLMSQEDEVYIGLGEGEVEAGDQLAIFRTNVKVFDPDTGALLGYHVEMLGWLEVRETYPESSLAEIGMSNGEIEVGDRVTPREPLPAEIAIQPSPEDVEGKISFFPDHRVLMGFNDFVYLNRGALDGLEVGSPLAVYRPGRMANDSTRGESVHVPDAAIGHMLVVRTEDQSAVALVTSTTTELKLGDRFHGER